MGSPHIRARDGKVRCALQDRYIRWHQADTLVRICERELAAGQGSERSLAHAQRRRDRLKPPRPYTTWAAFEADLRARGQL
jgi:hypothetical protein